MECNKYFSFKVQLLKGLWIKGTVTISTTQRLGQNMYSICLWWSSWVLNSGKVSDVVAKGLETVLE